jgi:CDP-glucose 4,6-dehydratase
MERPELLDQPFASQRALPELCSAFNFGPSAASNRTVAELVDELLAYSPGRWVDAAEADAPHEAKKLQLSIEKAREVLGWRPVWSFGETVRETAAWYQSQTDGKDPLRTTQDQIRRYEAAASGAGLAWAK